MNLLLSELLCPVVLARYCARSNSQMRWYTAVLYSTVLYSASEPATIPADYHTVLTIPYFPSIARSKALRARKSVRLRSIRCPTTLCVVSRCSGAIERPLIRLNTFLVFARPFRSKAINRTSTRRTSLANSPTANEVIFHLTRIL